MALTPRSGSSASTSSSSEAPKTSADSEGSNTPASRPFITNSAFNKYGLDTTEYPDISRDLVGFMRGKRVEVDYYRLLNREDGDNRTTVADLPTARNVLDSEYQKIRKLEITLPKSFEFTADNTKANMAIKGTALFYPGMNPNLGDLFTLPTGDGRVGICRVSSVTPMSWRDNRVYTIEFMVHEFATSANHDPTAGAVKLVSVFDKANYLGGTYSLLSETTYLNLQNIRKIRSAMCKLFHTQFFNSDVNSYLRPDGIYDPCLVKFMSHKISLSVVKVRPKNLLGQIATIYGRSLWATLESDLNNGLYLVYPKQSVDRYNQTTMGVFVTELAGRGIIFPRSVEDGQTYYLYSEAFYKGAVDTMTPEEKMVYNAIVEGNPPDLSVFIPVYLDTVRTLSPMDQFYKIPVYIHLIDMALLPQYREVDAPSMSLAAEGH